MTKDELASLEALESYEVAANKTIEDLKAQNLALRNEMSLDLDVRLAMRNVDESYKLAQEYLTAYLAECKERDIKPTTCSTKQLKYIRETLKSRKERKKTLQEIVEAGVIGGKSIAEIKEQVISVLPAYSKSLQDLTLSARDLMRLA